MHNTKRTHTDKHAYLQQFLHAAITHKLSAGAVFLWQYIYFAALEHNTYSNLHLRTAEVLKALAITRNGLQKVRHALAAAGFLAVRMDQHQQMYYTLMIDGKAIDDIDDADNSKADDDKNKADNNQADKHIVNKHKANKNHAGTTGCKAAALMKGEDVLADNTYRKLVTAFCAQYTTADAAGLTAGLMQFFHRRKEQGKTLTRAGLEALLDNLVHLAGENVRAMLDIIRQSIERGWSGFYPYKPAVAAAGNRMACHPSAGGRMPKYDTKKEDLDFLEW